jgi:hypothetical protein
VTVVLLYRLISFWALVPIGWGVWGWLEVAARHEDRTPRHHPWAVHRHGAGVPSVLLAPLATPAGPERVRRPRECDGCDERATTEPVVSGGT